MRDDDSTLEMKSWQRRTIGILTLGGSAVGIAAIMTEVPLSQLQGLSLVIVAMFAALFFFGLAVGVLIIENSSDSLSLALPFWLAQIPVIQSPWISYALFTGVKFDIIVQSDLNLAFEWAGGSHFNFYLGSGDSVANGANVIAIFVSYVIWKNRPRES